MLTKKEISFPLLIILGSIIAVSFAPNCAWAATGDIASSSPTLSGLPSYVQGGVFAFTSSLTGRLKSVSVYAMNWTSGTDVHPISPGDIEYGVLNSSGSGFITGCDFSLSSGNLIDSLPDDAAYHLVSFDLTSDDCELVSGTTYRFVAASADGSGNLNHSILMDGAVASPGYSGNANGKTGTVYQGYSETWFQASTDAPPLSDTSTRIISITPADQATVASSTAVTTEWTGYVNSDDFVASSTNLQVTLRRNTDIVQSASWNFFTNYIACIGVGAPGLSWCPLSDKSLSGTFPIDSSGSFDISTTTDIEADGIYYMDTKIVGPYFSLLGFSIGTKTLDEYTTSFVVNELTTTDRLTQDIASSTGAYAALDAVGDNCNIVGFDLGACLYSIFLPPTESFTDTFNQARDGVLGVFPLGYLTRTISLLSGNGISTSTLPALTIPIPEGYPGAGATIDLELEGKLWGDDDSSMLSTATDDISPVGGTASGKTLREVLEPGWDKICYVVFGLSALLPILGVVVEAWHIEEAYNESRRERADKMFYRSVDRDERYKRRTNYPWGH